MLLFGTLIFDGVSSSYAASSGKGTDVVAGTRKPKDETAHQSDTTAAIDRSRTFGDCRPVEGNDLAA